MKFVVDAHLPPGLCGLLEAAGHEAIHTSRLTAQNRTPDEILNELSFRERRVVVTKDHKPPVISPTTSTGYDYC
jgi:predicted nuclease of predicted toxin-antitoxin system